MQFKATVLVDSLSPTDDRLTTILATYPRYIHSEVLTHRMLTRNSASSRAIPVAKMLKMIEESPVVPVWWGANEAGMQAHAEIADTEAAKRWWKGGAAFAIAHARRGSNEFGLHKQIVNRVVEPYMWMTALISGTSWSWPNFFGLREHKDAEPHFQKIAGEMKAALASSEPKVLKKGQWHRPLVNEDEDRPLVLEALRLGKKVPKKNETEEEAVERLLTEISVGRCARVSYLTHDGRRDITEDVGLHDRLMVQEPLHASPAEHVAQAIDYPRWFPVGLRKPAAELNALRWENRARQDETGTISQVDLMIETALSQIQSGNFRGFRQYRKTKSNEHIGERML